MKENKKQKYLLDSSVYISYLNKSDIFHKKTTKYIQQLSSQNITFIVPVVVYLEIGNILQKNNPLFQPEKLKLFFTNHEFIGLDQELAEYILPYFKKYSLKTSDAIILSTAQITNSVLVTWDKQLKKTAKKYVSTDNPTP